MGPETSTCPQASSVQVRGDGAAPVQDVDALLGALNHALANALNTIAAASKLAEMLVSRGKVDECAGSLGRIEGECMRAARLMRDGRAFLGFNERRSDARVNITALLRTCAKALEGFGKVSVEVGSELPPVSGDVDALRRLFAELLDNAFQFGARKVQVTLEALAAGHTIRITFRDDGPGIAPGTDIFAPFVSTCPAEHSGLGLPLAARIAAAHDGTIERIESERGAAFRIWLRSI